MVPLSGPRAAWYPPRMRKILGWLAAAVALVPWTWLWFMPVAGFHHMFRCGLLGWAILDEENGPNDVRWSGALLALSVLGWSSAFVVWWLVRRRLATR